MDKIPMAVYFAAHAPEQIPSWFEHVKPERLEYIPTNLHTEDDRQAVFLWEDVGCDLPEHLKWYQEACEENNRRSTLNINKEGRERYLQWRKYYGEEMAKMFSDY